MGTVTVFRSEKEIKNFINATAADQDSQWYDCYFGLRYCSEVYVDGDVLPRSRIWENGNPTDKYDVMTSTIGIGEQHKDVTTEDVHKALELVRKYKDYGEELGLVGTVYEVEDGEEEGEMYMVDPSFFGYVEIEPKA